MPSWEPVPGYTNLCERFRRSNSSKDCTWNILTTVWEVRGLQAYGGQGNNNLVIRVEHLGVSQEVLCHSWVSCNEIELTVSSAVENL
jgi:hypothetical protein